MMFRGWILVLWTALAVSATAGAVFAAHGTADLESVRHALRLTARIALALFLLAFAASSLRRLWPVPATGWLLRNRRFVGVSFAVAHFIHLGLVASLLHFDPARFDSLLRLVPGAGAYLWLAVMTATSFDRTRRWIGQTWWRRLHLAGSWWIWAVFIGNLAPKARQHIEYVLVVLLFVGVAALRAVAWRRARAAKRR
jgi:sulfoxide reductase heme-binding subunit YedZ